MTDIKPELIEKACEVYRRPNRMLTNDSATRHHDRMAAALEDVADDLRAEGAVKALEKVAKLHSPIAIYDECECEDKSTPDHVTDHVTDHDIGPSCNHVYDACRECCGLTDGAGYWWMHERCSMHLYGHRHETDEPICATRAAITSALSPFID